MSKTSDYTLNRLRIDTLIPEVYRSDTLVSILENTINRMLTKPELRHVSGFIGQGNPFAKINRQIQEDTTERQVAQLQPMLHTKTGTVEHIMSYADVLTKLDHQGVDVSAMKVWGDATAFNWLPPVSIDKLTNYGDYYWYDAESPGSRPQYITIENKCPVARARTTLYDNVIAQYGQSIEVGSINTTTNTFIVNHRDVSNVISAGFVFTTTSSVENDTLHNAWWVVESSSYDQDTGHSHITVTGTVSVDTPTATVSIELLPYREMLQRDRECICNGTVGWDMALWDDNSLGNSALLWNAAQLELISHETESLWLAANSKVVPVDLDLWYDTSVDELKQWAGTEWKTIHRSFSIILDRVEGRHYWDLSVGCLQEMNQWSAQNRWIHKSVVPNFTIAKQAQLPIIEYLASTVLNEWTETTHNWAYRETKFSEFAPTTMSPSMFELVDGIEFEYSAGTFTLDSKYGDLTQTFIPGFVFVATTNVPEQMTTTGSVFVMGVDGEFRTVVSVAVSPSVAPSAIRPALTSGGDDWREYHEHWAYLGQNPSHPVSPQPLNPLVDLSNIPMVVYNDGVADVYQHRSTNYAEEFLTLTPDQSTFVLNSSLHKKSWGNFSQTRVYVDGFRQYGNYTEITDVDGYVIGIELNVLQPQYTTIRVEVAPATVAGFGWQVIDVRTELDETTWMNAGEPLTTVDLTVHKRHEQIKTAINQYPLFDIYDVDSTSLRRANPIFAFVEDRSKPLNTHISRRLAGEHRNYVFEQFLIDDDNSNMYAYRVHPTSVDQYWVNPVSGSVTVWDGRTWADVIKDGDYLIRPVTATETPDTNVPGALWYNPDLTTVFRRQVGVLITDKANTNTIIVDGNLSTTMRSCTSVVLSSADRQWKVASVLYVPATNNTHITLTENAEVIEVGHELTWTGVTAYVSQSDPTLQTIWKTGSPRTQYVPRYVDSNNNEVTVGASFGDWEVPHQLYYNVSHENRKRITSTELLGHAISIINAQQKTPGFFGDNRQTYHLAMNPNVGLGGTIKEFSYSYDTLLSSVYTEGVTPVALIEFARDQYRGAIRTIEDMFRTDVVRYLTDTTPSTIIRTTDVVINGVVNEYETNDAVGLLFGDSTTYDTVTQTGIRNWIMTVPFLGTVAPTVPALTIDDKLGILEVIHHDGHRSAVGLSTQMKETIIQRLIRSADTRDHAEGKIGLQSATPPPSTIAGYLSAYGNTRVHGGVYWYQTVGTSRTLYRFAVPYISTFQPATNVPDGTMWLDTSTNTLKEFDGSSWVATSAPNDITSAWKHVDLDMMLANVLLAVEAKIFEAIPSNITDRQHLFEQLVPSTNERDWLLEQQFGTYTKLRGIVDPYTSQTTFDPTDAFSWNYKYSTPDVLPSSTNQPGTTGGVWQDLYSKLYNTPYPHLEPWRLQGYRNKPTWWDAEYAETDGSRRWKYDHATSTGMWENIRVGYIPPQYQPPECIVPSYEYFSVNIADVQYGVYRPDDLLPPYWNHTAYGIPTSTVRSVFYDLSTQVANYNLDYEFGDSGPIEWEWKTSSYYHYDQLISGYRSQPARFMHALFGNEYYTIGHLDIDIRTKKVFSHKDTIFHGDVVNNKDVYRVNGLNQWYVNYTRFRGVDISSSNFRRQWANWDTKLGYRFASFIDSGSLSLTSPVFDIVERDYNVTVKKSPGIIDKWMDALNVTVHHIPPKLAQYSTDGLWKFIVNTPSPTSREIKAYGVRNYKFLHTVGTSFCTLYKYNIVAIDVQTNTLIVPGNQTDEIRYGTTVTLTNAGANNGQWIATSAIYNAHTHQTHIKVDEQLNAFTGGTLTAHHRTLPWTTGDAVVVSSTERLPTPLSQQQTYYIIRHSDNTFSFAETQAEAFVGTAILLSTAGSGEFTVGQIRSTFTVNGVNWRQYELDKSYTQTIAPPTVVNGVYGLVNFVYGYAEYLKDIGFESNADSSIVTENGSPVSWNTEVVDLIEWIQAVQVTKFSSPDTFAAQVADDLSSFVFTASVPVWGTGTKVAMITTDTMPAPFINGQPYYVIRDPSNPSSFALALTPADAINGNAILVMDSGAGGITVQQVVESASQSPTKIAGAFRNKVWATHPVGVLTNVRTGPFTDIRTELALYDQDGNQIHDRDIFVTRRDSQCMLRIGDDAVTVSGRPTMFGGVHLFFDGYEHAVLFSNYSASGALIYDPYIGLNTPRFNLQFYRQPTFTLRPNVGGFFLHGGDIVKNIENSVSDLRFAYDVYQSNEADLMTRLARDTIGYPGTQHHLSNININAKSQFNFWRGMIQSKGSVDSMKAFINSRRFVDAKLDEFWALRVAEYGAVTPPKYLQLNLFASDALHQELKVEFTSSLDAAVDSGFERVATNDTTRWYEFPTQRKALDELGTVHFGATIAVRVDNPDVTQPFVSSVPCDKYFEVLNDDTVNELVPVNAIYVGAISPDAKLVYGIIVDHNVHNTPKIIDHKSGTVITLAPLWDPARGYHYHVADHTIDLRGTVDPAVYSSAADMSLIGDRSWNSNEVSTTWLDTSRLEYVPYYDSAVFPSVTAQSTNWGRMSAYGRVDLYEWTESTIHPAEWDSVASVESLDRSIPDGERKSGQAHRVLVKNVAGTYQLEADTIIRVAGIQFSSATLPTDGIVDVYVNGVLKGTYDLDNGDVIPTSYAPQAHVTVVRRAHAPTDEELENGDYKYDYPHTAVTSIGDDGITKKTTYYFWVKNKTTRNGRTLSLLEASKQLAEIPTPYVIPRKPDSDLRYTQMIVKGLANTVTADDRFILRMTHDFTLRTELAEDSLALKNAHTEWQLFRKDQPYHVTRALWNKLTEAMMGVTRDENRRRVPNASFELYDAVHGTDTQYGLRDGQTFVDKQTGLASVLADLNSPHNDFYPVDIHEFFANNSFDTVDGIEKAMDTIYNTFSHEHVNRIFFSVLMDAFAKKAKHPDIFKTSMIALHGIRVLETAGMYDD